MTIIAAGIAKKGCQFVTQIGAQGGNVIAAMLNAVVIELLSHAVRATLDTGTGAGAVIFISWRDGGTGTQQQCTWNK